MNISGTNASQLGVSGTQASGAIQGTGKGTGAAPAARTSEDTVHLSAKAQASALHHGGSSVKQIAASLGVTASVVNSYLGITTPAKPAASSTPAVHAEAPESGSASASPQPAAKK